MLSRYPVIPEEQQLITLFAAMHAGWDCLGILAAAGLRLDMQARYHGRTLASMTREAAAHISGPVPSPMMKGMTGLSGTQSLPFCMVTAAPSAGGVNVKLAMTCVPL